MSGRWCWLYCAAVLTALLACAAVAPAAPVLDFEGRAQAEWLTTQYQPSLGVTFTNAQTAVVPGWNYQQYPPHSGVTVAMNANGLPTFVDFAAPITSFAGYFTYYNPLTLTGYDAGNNVVATASSLYRAITYLPNPTSSDKLEADDEACAEDVGFDPMKWTRPEHGRSEVATAGKIVSGRRDQTARMSWDAAFDIAGNWRSSHGYPLHVFTVTLHRRAKEIDSNALVARRLKRMPSILAKLAVNRDMKMYQLSRRGNVPPTAVQASCVVSPPPPRVCP